VLRAAEGTETTQENIRHWFELTEEDPGLQLLVLLLFLMKVMQRYVYSFSSVSYYKCFYLFSKIFSSSRALFTGAHCSVVG
jgi:TRAP-type mannitol/chloroaromatic compound transport system permease small subunit